MTESKQKYFNDLKLSFTNVLTEKPSEREIAVLIKHSRNILTVHIRKTKPHILPLCQKFGFDLSDLAIDCLSEMFSRKENDSFYLLKKFCSSLNSQIEHIAGHEFYLAYKKFLAVVADKQIAGLYAEWDPNGFRITRNIKETVRKIEGIELASLPIGYKLRFNVTTSDDKIHAADIDTLKFEFIKKAKGKNNTGDLLNTLLEVTKEYYGSVSELPLYDVVNLFKDYYGYETKNDFLEEVTLGGNFEYETVELNQIKNKITHEIELKIYIDYYLKNKINKEQAGALRLVIKDVIDTWINHGEEIDALYERFNTHYKISRSDYVDFVKTKLEYLIKETKKKFINYIFAQA